jgi:Domain of unknown function (DUF4062)
MAIPKYLVFVSSTFKNMEEARKAAISGVSDARHLPISLDNFAPQNSSDMDVIKREVKNCQIYILILGPTYGEIPSGHEKSYIEIEFDLAEQANRYVLVFTLQWKDIIEVRKGLLGDDKHRQELENTGKLEKFYKRVRNGKHFYKTWRWNDTDQIRREVGCALTELPYLPNAPKGLIPEPDFHGDLVDSVTQNEFLRGMVSAIRSFDKLYDRTQQNVESKTKAAEFLAELYSTRMESDLTKGIFFESGSSVAFVADTLPWDLWRKVVFGKHGEPSKRISTNNVLVYLLLWLSKGVPCAHFPWGVPESTYGASYGPIGELVDREPNFEGKHLDKAALDAIKSLGSAKLALTAENTSLIITAASGLQLGRRHDITSEKGYRIPDHVRATVEKCFGPHVGSYKNKILKRYLYQTKIPTVLVMDKSKVNCPIDVRKCHFIFGSDLSWEEVLADHPLALCVGCKTEELNELTDEVGATMPGFEIVPSEQTRMFSALIARNKAFETAFPEMMDAESEMNRP